MPEQPDRGADDPETKPQANGGRERSVDDGNGARRASKQDRLDEGAMNRCVETGNGLVVVHHTSAPPPKEKKDKKNELAQKRCKAKDDLDQSSKATARVRRKQGSGP